MGGEGVAICDGGSGKKNTPARRLLHMQIQKGVFSYIEFNPERPPTWTHFYKDYTVIKILLL